MSPECIPENEKQDIYRKLEEMRFNSTQQQFRALKRELRSHTRKWIQGSLDAAGHDFPQGISDTNPSLNTEAEQERIDATKKPVPGAKLSVCASSMSVRSFSGVRFSSKSSVTEQVQDSNPPMDLACRLKKSLADARNQASFIEPQYTAEYGVIAQMLQTQARNILFRRRLSELYLINSLKSAADDLEIVANQLSQLLYSIIDHKGGESAEMSSQPNKHFESVSSKPDGSCVQLHR